MAYFLKKTKTKKGLYLQLYETNYYKNTGKSNNHCYRKLGYYEELKVKYGEDYLDEIYNEIKELNEGITVRDIGADSKYIKEGNIYEFGYIVIYQILNSLDIRNKWKDFNLDVNMYDLLIRTFISEYSYYNLVCFERPTKEDKKNVSQYIDNNIDKIVNFFKNVIQDFLKAKWYINSVNNKAKVFGEDSKLLYIKELTEQEKNKLIRIETALSGAELKRKYDYNNKIIYVAPYTNSVKEFTKDINKKVFRDLTARVKGVIKKGKVIIFQNQSFNGDIDLIKKDIFIDELKTNKKERTNLHCLYNYLFKLLDPYKNEIGVIGSFKCIKIARNNYVNISDLYLHHGINFNMNDFFLLQFNDRMFENMKKNNFFALFALEEKVKNKQKQ